MPVEIRFRIDPEAEEKVKALGPKAIFGMETGLKKASRHLATEAQTLIRRSPRGGKTYRVGKGRKRRHKASAPGEPPARDIGDLLRSIKPRVEVLTGIVEAEIGYAGYLEEGTSKMAARPFLRPALTKEKDAIDKIITEEIDRAIE